MTERQINILAAIVEQYAKTAQPIGSLSIAEFFDISPATIRAEMAHLEYMGYIYQPHTSSGRVPTDTGYRYYVDNLAQRKPTQAMSRSAQAMQRRVTSAGEAQQAMRSAVDSLVDITRNASMVSAGPYHYLSGLGMLFSKPEFRGGDVTEVARLLDNIEPWLREVSPNQKLSVYIGNENPIGKSSGCSLVISRFRSSYSDASFIGVIGPTRQNYRRTMRIVERAGEVLEEMMV